VAIVALVFTARPFAAHDEASPQASQIPEEIAPSAGDAAVIEVEGIRSDQPTSRGGIRFTVAPVEPSYTVVSGDSLSAIAQRYSTTIDALQAINNLPDRSTLSVGQRLVIP
jgi:LysM repeat protein